MNYSSNTSRSAFFALGFSAVAALATTPQITSVTMAQDQSRSVIVAYTLEGGDAVVTLDVQTNANTSASADDPGWTSIGGAAICNAKGDVWNLVEAGSRTITWEPALSWPNHKIPAGGARAVVTAWTTDNTPDYMAVDISSVATAATPRRYYPAADFVPGGVTNSLYKTTVLLMRKIMARDITWTMGSTSAEKARSGTTEKNFNLALTNNYYIGIYEITQSQWGLVATNSGAAAYYKYENSMRPMETVAYNEIRNTHSTSPKSNTRVEAGTLSWEPSSDSFLGLLNLKTGLDFDLPSEAQWEYACRAGNGSGYWGDGSPFLYNSGASIGDGATNVTDANLSRIGRYSGNAGILAWEDMTEPENGGTAIVGSYSPNTWGLYDMHGNVLEICLDWFENDVSMNGGMTNIDPTDVTKTLSGAAGGERCRRGGAFGLNVNYARAARRLGVGAHERNRNLGFRVICRAGLK